MSEVRKKRGENSREAILTAAEAVFAEHGFDGARVDVIAEASGYNKTLIFRYFGDKVGLYTEVLKRSDQEFSELMAQVFAPLLADETIATDAHRFRAFLKATFETTFDYAVEHPRFTRIINWEHAEGWQTLNRIASQFEPRDFEQLEMLFRMAQQAGLLRPGIDIVIVLLLTQQICLTLPPALPLYQPFLAGRELSAAATLSLIREQAVAFLIAGIMRDSEDES